ncbi:hypothetical protein BDV96DRAFT_646070 [Lophiotrema nucula]|uniref:Uncharacterized protein n=1 Tax=Lophiotrema nucula TaxID=690887 RepID=A0A6A5Z9L8_9PLEO|nr:hypothetical protein BDV96DRAFT_646070 [Lophiotrema nucula]
MSLRTSYPVLLRTYQATHRSLTSSARLLDDKMMGDNPKANQPDSGPNKKVRDDTPNTDSQSNASQQEQQSGDDHPAKQPDPQSEPTRSTGIGGQNEVKGGKEGMGAPTDG